MDSLKKKIEESSKKKRSFAVKEQRAVEVSGDESDIIERFWNEELQSLQGSHFGSVDAAIQCIVDKVLLRLKMDNEADDGLKDFLLDLFEHDPELRESLSDILNIAE